MTAQNTSTTTTHSTRRRSGLRAVVIWTVVILSLCTTSGLVGWLFLDTATSGQSELRRIQVQNQIEREQAVAEARLVGAVAWQWMMNLLKVSIPVMAVALLAWIVIRRFSIVRADSAGGYPLFWLPRIEVHVPRRCTDEQGTRWLPLFSFRARLIDPNRNPGTGIELGERVTLIQADTVSDAQMQVTSQAQLVQAERARAAGTMLVQNGGQRGSSSTILPGGHLYRPIPEPNLLAVSSSHIERLLAAQGEAAPSIIDVTPTARESTNG